jgi:hypothetical protein
MTLSVTTDNQRGSDCAVSRRRWMTAAGGFVLAASGLFLPEVGGEAGAREGVLGSATGGRHRNNDRGGHKHRKHRHKKHRDEHRSTGGGWRNVALYIHNLRPTAVAVRQWKTIGFDDIIRWGPMTEWLTIDGKPESGPEHFIDFASDLKGFAVELNTGHIIEVTNALLSILPKLTLGVGGWSEHGWDPQGATLINQGFFEWEIARAPGFGVQRLNDTDTHKQFLVDLA